MIHCWSFDPGLVTGWCHLSVHDDGEIGIFNSGEADHQGIGNLLFDNQSLKAAVSKRDIFETIFIVEKYIMRDKITQSPWSLETTGLIRYFAGVYHVPFITYTSSEAKNLIRNENIKKAGLWVSGGDGHSTDAVRLALYHLVVKKGLLKGCLRKDVNT